MALGHPPAQYPRIRCSKRPDGPTARSRARNRYLARARWNRAGNDPLTIQYRCRAAASSSRSRDAGNYITSFRRPFTRSRRTMFARIGVMRALNRNVERVRPGARAHERQHASGRLPPLRPKETAPARGDELKPSWGRAERAGTARFRCGFAIRRHH